MTVVVLDACILYPPALRDLFMWLAAGIVFHPRWTEEIHAEWIRNVLEDNPEIAPEQLERTRRLMDAIHEESIVTDYEKHTPTLILPDKDDRHVLAAAIEAKAAIIVTFNLADFPAATLKEYDICALHPDKYLVSLFDEAPELFLAALKNHRASLKRPPKDVEEYLQTLKGHGLTNLALLLEDYHSSL